MKVARNTRHSHSRLSFDLLFSFSCFFASYDTFHQLIFLQLVETATASMTSLVRILTTSTLDSSPAVLLVGPNGRKTLINCGEGCQRAFLELAQRVSTVHRICLTHLAHDSVGGLPGMILTTADVADRAILQAVAAASNGKKARPEEPLPGLDLIGPKGTKDFIHSLRHFMRRDKFELRVNEGKVLRPTKVSTKQKGRRKEEEAFIVETIPLQYESGAHRPTGATKRPRTGPIETQSYVFTTPPVFGTFLAQKAKELGIPPGPLYGKLKSGQSVTFRDKAGVERTIQSHEVVTKGSPGVSVAVLYYPSLDVLQQLQTSEVMQRFSPSTSTTNSNSPEESPCLELIVHMTPKSIFSSSQCQDWLKQWGSTVQHVLLEAHATVAEFLESSKGKTADLTPFRSGALGAFRRSLLSPDIFPSPLVSASVSGSSDTADAVISDQPELMIQEATPLLEYVLIPRAKTGFMDGSQEAVLNEQDVRAEAEGCGAVQLAQEILHNRTTMPIDTTVGGELLFTGTGSAMPCKHRNVSGIMLRMSNGNAMMLDIGEGTVGQVLRSTSPDQDPVDTLKSIKAAWISHPHADHHLGLLRLLTERHVVVDDADDPLILIAPPNLFRFLDEYAAIDHRVQGSYEALDCREMEDQMASNTRITKLYSKLGISSCVAVPVSHCPHAYAVVLDGTPFGRVAYSGDCRPSKNFATAALNADLLIHEATFEDGMEGEAVLKKHCTVSEALAVASDMKAKAVVLTHFSQRYPKISPVYVKNQLEISDPLAPIVFAFDFMKVTPSNVTLASDLVPALRLLYPDEVDEANEEVDEEESKQPSLSASEILGTVGLFAHFSKISS